MDEKFKLQLENARLQGRIEALEEIVEHLAEKLNGTGQQFLAPPNIYWYPVYPSYPTGPLLTGGYSSTTYTAVDGDFMPLHCTDITEFDF